MLNGSVKCSISDKPRPSHIVLDGDPAAPPTPKGGGEVTFAKNVHFSAMEACDDRDDVFYGCTLQPDVFWLFIELFVLKWLV